MSANTTRPRGDAMMHEGKAAYVDPPSVPFGPQSIAGYGFSAVGLVMAVLALLEGDRSEQTVGTIVFGVGSLVALVVTNRNRTEQAKNLATLASRERTAQPMAQMITGPGVNTAFENGRRAAVEAFERAERMDAPERLTREESAEVWTGEGAPRENAPRVDAESLRRSLGMESDDLAGEPPDDGLDGDEPIGVPPEETRELQCGGDA